MRARFVPVAQRDVTPALPEQRRDGDIPNTIVRVSPRGTSQGDDYEISNTFEQRSARFGIGRCTGDRGGTGDRTRCFPYHGTQGDCTRSDSIGTQGRCAGRRDGRDAGTADGKLRAAGYDGGTANGELGRALYAP